MKSLILLSCVFVFIDALDKTLVAELLEKLQEYGLECAEQENPPPSDMEALMRKQAPSTHEGKCTIFCVLKKFNIMTDDTTFGEGDTVWLDKAKADDPEFYESLMKVYKICEADNGKTSDGCENAFQLAACSKYEGIKAGIDKVLDE